MLQRVLNKMPQGKVKKAELRSAKPMAVKLAKVDDLSKIAYDIQDVYETAEYQMDEGYAIIESSFDMMREKAWSPLTDLKEELDKIKSGLDDLGVEYPDELTELDNRVYDIETEVNRIFKNFESYGLYT
jgi:SMC interacting uncharacterized protein involved in chromosome segregation